MTAARDKLNRLKQMADEAEREHPEMPVKELLDLQLSLRRTLPKMRKLRAAGFEFESPAMAARIGGMCREMEELLTGTPDVDKPVALTTDHRVAAVLYWGRAGAYAYDAYDRIRAALYPELPGQIPIVIGLTAYGHCLGLTRGHWEHGPRITLPPEVFRGTTAEDARRSVPGGPRQVDDLLTHEMLHVWLHETGRTVKHDSADWYEAVQRLSPAVLGRDLLGARRGGARKSVRVPNPAYAADSTEPKTVVRKQQVHGAVKHGDVARWPYAFRPDDYDWGTPIPCPTY